MIIILPHGVRINVSNCFSSRPLVGLGDLTTRTCFHEFENFTLVFAAPTEQLQSLPNFWEFFMSLCMCVWVGVGLFLDTCVCRITPYIAK